jgi:hypothetical protein
MVCNVAEGGTEAGLFVEDAGMAARQECFALPFEFWVRFARNHWEKSPLLLKQLFSTPLATPEGVFRGLVKACEPIERNCADNAAHLFVEQTLLEADVKRYLPQSADESLSGYVNRVSDAFGGQRVALVVPDYPACDLQTWLRLREFLRPLYGVVGLPGDPSQPVVFLGNYGATPGGLHTDLCGAFVFVVAGRKRFRLWPEQYFSGHPETRGLSDVRPFLDDAITLEGEPGDVLYWPSTYWHIADSSDGVTASLTVPMLKAVWSSDDRHLRQRMLRLIEDRLEVADSSERRVFPVGTLQDYATKIPAVARHATRTLKGILRAPGFEDELKVLWLNHVSSLGFNRVPPPLADSRLNDDAIIQGNSRFPVLWLRGTDGRLICSANGHCFSLNGHPNVPKLLKRLNSEEPCHVASLMQEYAGLVDRDDVEFEASPEDIRSLLEKLYSLRAANVV